MLEHLRQKIAKSNADALLVTQPANVRYLSGFTSPEDARILITPEKVLFITDGRYTVQAQQEVKNPEVKLETLIIPTSTTPVIDYLANLVKPYKLAVEANHMTLDVATAIKEKSGRDVIPTRDLVTEFRLVKTPQEIEYMREAAALADKAFTYTLNVLDAGMTEIEVALELERFLRKQGSEGVAFDIVVASGERSAMPHGRASQKTIHMGELVTLDFGGHG
jgi:Xaa-Pro aminopeptidase